MDVYYCSSYVFFVFFLQPQSTEITKDNRKLDPYGSWTNFLGHSTNPKNIKKGDRGKGNPRVKTPSSVSKVRSN
jgi:hypothetical protein